MRKELEYHKVNKTKLKQVKDLIEQIAHKKDNIKEALCKLHEITGKEYKESDFYEYWGFMDLEDFAKLISVQEPLLVRDLTREELCWRSKRLTASMTRCAQPHKEICRFAAAGGAILTANFIDREYNRNY